MELKEMMVEELLERRSAIAEEVNAEILKILLCGGYVINNSLTAVALSAT